MRSTGLCPMPHSDPDLPPCVGSGYLLLSIKLSLLLNRVQTLSVEDQIKDAAVFHRYPSK